jgi:hypothetical protein
LHQFEDEISWEVNVADLLISPDAEAAKRSPDDYAASTMAETSDEETIPAPAAAIIPRDNLPKLENLPRLPSTNGTSLDSMLVLAETPSSVSHICH